MAREDYAAVGVALSAAAGSAVRELKSAGHDAAGELRAAARYGDRLAHVSSSAAVTGFDEVRHAVESGVSALMDALGGRLPA